MTPATNSLPQRTRPATPLLPSAKRHDHRHALAVVALCASFVLIACGGGGGGGGGDTAQVSQTKDGSPVVVAASPQKPTVTVTAQRPAAPPQPSPGQFVTLPAVVMNTDLKTLDGKTLRLASYKGKVVVLDLWATWCGPCRVEIPHLIALGNEFKKRGVEVVGLTIEDPAKDAVKVKKFADEFKIDYKLGWSPNEVSRGLMGNQTNIPQTFILTRDGRIFKRFIGFNPQATPPQIRAAIEQALTVTG